MAMAHKLHVPPRALFGNILRAVIGHVVLVVHGLNPGSPIPIEPGLPDGVPRLAFAVAPQGVYVKAGASWVLTRKSFQPARRFILGRLSCQKITASALVARFALGQFIVA
jgi:hypothetical protein